MQLTRDDDLLRPDSGFLFWLLLSLLVISSSTSLLLFYVLFVSSSTWESWQLRNRYVDLWIALLLVFFTAHSLHLILERHKKARGQLILHNAFYVLMLLLYVEIAASWDVYGRGDLALGCATVVVVCILNVYISVTKNVDHKKYDDGHNDDIATERSRLLLTDLSSSTSSSPPDSSSSSSSLLRDLGHVLRLSVLLLSCLLLHGALHHGLGVQKWLPMTSSKMISVPSAMGFETRIYYECNGNDTQLPTIILEGGFDQGVADWVGVSKLLTKHNLRVCVWDKPGIGFSDYAYPRDIRRPIKTYYTNLVRGLRRHEPDFGPPYVMVGFGEGALLVKDFTLTLNYNNSKNNMEAMDDEEELVQSLILIEPWSSSSLFRSDFESTLLNALGAPLGLLDYLVRPVWVSADFWAREERERRRWLETTEKTWNVRQFKRKHLTHFKSSMNFNSTIDDISTFNNGSNEHLVNVGVPVHVIMSAPSSDAVDRKCFFDNSSPDECALRRDETRQSSLAKRNEVANGGSLFVCNWDECDSNFFLYKKPLFTANAIREVIGHSDSPNGDVNQQNVLVPDMEHEKQ